MYSFLNRDYFKSVIRVVVQLYPKKMFLVKFLIIELMLFTWSTWS